MHNINNKLGFTLAEVLITLAIIGVVAMLTIPTALKNYKNKVYSASLKKVYSQITDAAGSIISDEHAGSFYSTTAGVKNNCTATDTNPVAGPCYFLDNYFKTTNKCESPGLPCTADTYYAIDGSNPGDVFGDHCIQTSSGAGICMSYEDDFSFSRLFVDINGPAEPNTVGLDAFVMKIESGGQVTDISLDSNLCNNSGAAAMEAYGDIADYAVGCLSKVIENGWIISD